MSSIIKEKKKFLFKLKLSFTIISTWWIVAFFQHILHVTLRGYSLSPKNTSQIIGVFTYPFIHGDFEHLSNNSLSAFVIFSSLFLIHEKISLKVLAIIYVFSGIILWFIGEKGSLHIGASSVIYGVAFFLFFSSIIIRKNSSLAIAFFMILWYGSMILGITPFTVKDGISWEGHLSGAIVGIVLSFWFYRKEFTKKDDYFGEEDDDDFHFYERFPLENYKANRDEKQP